MEQIRNFEWAQDKIDALTKTERAERHEAQRVFAGENRAERHEAQRVFAGENRAQRRERERQERKAAKRKAKA